MLSEAWSRVASKLKLVFCKSSTIVKGMESIDDAMCMLSSFVTSRLSGMMATG